MTDEAGPHTVVAVVVAAVAGYSLALNLLLPDWAHVPANLAFAAGLVLAAHRSGSTAADLGLDRARLPAGIRLGLAAAAAVAAAVAVAALIPATRSLFEDERFAGVTWAEAAFELLVRIPLGTALFEEVVFRSVLLGLFLRRTSVAAAVAASSFLFGLWHILPTLADIDTSAVGDQADSAWSEAGLVAGVVAFTAVAGAVFAWLRLRSRSVAAPVLAHAAVNVSAYLAGYVIVRYGWA